MLITKTVTTRRCIAPRDNKSIRQQGSKGCIRTVDCFYVLKLVLHIWTVPSAYLFAPGDDRFIAFNPRCIFKLTLHRGCISAFFQAAPGYTTEQSKSIAVNADLVASMRNTLLVSCCCIAELSPPWSSIPQVMTDRSSKTAAKAFCGV